MGDAYEPGRTLHPPIKFPLIRQRDGSPPETGLTAGSTPAGGTVREPTKSDLPKGNEAQCVLCWRMFTSDSACERHKPYSKPKTDICKYPEIVGLEPFERRGLVVWTRRRPEAVEPPE